MALALARGIGSCHMGAPDDILLSACEIEELLSEVIHIDMYNAVA